MTKKKEPIKTTSVDELYTNGAYEVKGKIMKQAGEYLLVGICTKSEYPSTKKVGERVEWPVFRRGTKKPFSIQQFKTIKQLRTEKIDSIIDV